LSQLWLTCGSYWVSSDSLGDGTPLDVAFSQVHSQLYFWVHCKYNILSSYFVPTIVLTGVWLYLKIKHKVIILRKTIWGERVCFL